MSGHFKPRVNDKFKTALNEANTKPYALRPISICN